MINLRTFDLNLLRVFEAIFHDRSVSLAADRLGMSQPAVSNSLNRLRRDFEDPLFVRVNRRMEPTPKAQQFAAFVDGGLGTIRAGLTSGIAFDPRTSKRRFNLLMTDVGEVTFFPKILKSLAREAPNIDLNVLEYGLQGYSELLESGAVDLAIGRIDLGDSFQREFIHTSPFTVVLSRDNSFLDKDANGQLAITREGYLDAPHILLEPRGASGDPVRKALGGDAGRRRIALSVPHATVLPYIMEGTELVATIPTICARNMISSGGLCLVDPPFAIEPNMVYQWWHKRNTEDEGHRWLRELFVSAKA